MDNKKRKFSTFEELDRLRSSTQVPLFFSEKGEESWEQVVLLIAELKQRLDQHKERDYLLRCDSIRGFTIGFLALLYSQKRIHLPSLLTAKTRDKFPYPLLSDNEESADLCIFNPSLAETDLENLEIYETLKASKIEESQIILYTSGSTGESKQIVKSWDQMEAEFLLLAKRLQKDFTGYRFYTTADHHHLYGLTFALFFPLLAKGSIAEKKIHYPTRVFELENRPSVLVSTPAFYKRLVEIGCKKKEDLHLFSGAGFMTAHTAYALFEKVTPTFVEFYGSTETGVIGQRTSPDSPWHLLDELSLEERPEGLFLDSPCLADAQRPFKLEDGLNLISPTHFHLLGRLDSVVKIEDKRVSLPELEERLLETGVVRDVASIVLKGRRDRIGVAIELNQKGQERFKESQKREINLFFTTFLSQYFHPMTLAGRWRYVDSIPRNSIGKIAREALLSLFSDTEKLVSLPLIHKQEIDEERLLFQIEFPKNYRYFDGHFPLFPILPGVAQVDLVMTLLSSHKGIPKKIAKMRRVKFMAPICPEERLSLSIEYDPAKSKASFHFFSSQNKKSSFSRGEIEWRD